MYFIVCAVCTVCKYLVSRDDSSPKCCVYKTLSCSSTQLLMKVSKSCSWWDAVSVYHELIIVSVFMLFINYVSIILFLNCIQGSVGDL